MSIFSWFSKSPPTDYETVLARLATDINDAKKHLSEIRLRERRSSLLINAYGLALWAVWVGLWWVRGLPFGLLGWSSDGLEWKAVGGGGVAAGPLGIYLLNRLLHYLFYRQRSSEETHLRVLLTEQRKQLDSIKKATNYDSTRKLIERYDESGPPQMGMPMGSSPSTPTRKMPVSPSAASRRGTPRAPGHLVGAGGTPGSPMPVPPGFSPDQAAALHLQMQAIQPVLPTPEKKWYDRVVDSILGDDPAHATQSKYALVCGECFRHNGLVGSKYEWERMQWSCPRCNHMNPSPLSRLKSDPSPTSSSTPSQPSQSTPSPATPSQPSRASPRLRPNVERGTPRSSRLGQEVFSATAAAEEEDEGEEGEQDELEKMQVDNET